MAKKKRKRHRNPVAPPVHSAPASSFVPHPTTPDEGGPVSSAEPEIESGSSIPAAPAKPRRPKDSSRRARARQRTRRRTWIIVTLVAVGLVGALVGRQIIDRRALAEFHALAENYGCGQVQNTGGSGADQHLAPGQTTEYDTSPPTHGPHAPTTLPAGIYGTPLSDDPAEQNTIYRAVHSLEHGAIIVWHNDLSSDELDALEGRYRNERKVLLVPYPDLEGDTRIALTAWGRKLQCEQPSVQVIDGFIDRFREARTAPEPNQPI